MLVFFFSCKCHKNSLTIEKLNVGLSGGNNYAQKSNQGGIEIFVTPSDSAISILKKLDVYSPLKDPITLSVKRKNNSVILTDKSGKEFALAFADSSEKNCNYSCKTSFYKEDKISFISHLAFFPYWHGFSALGGHPLFMRRHYYTLLIKKEDGKKLKMRWTYSVQKYKAYNSRRLKWSGDYCVDNGGGLTLLKITN
ncbi:MAG: hypothetical protein JNJ40_09770 [Bacteroidia bacterium]|nr:hypothetical protein [Bacteroidia bacterium]